jgi:protein required for attachment to host cells
MSKRETWALVTDGVRARILRGVEGRAGTTVELVSKTSSAHLRALLAEEKERTLGGEAVRRDMRDFARETLRLLDQHRLAGDFDRLAIFAPAAMLGFLRETMPPGLRTAVAAEVAANLVHAPADELRAAVHRVLTQSAGGPGR